jgi:LemA protein
MILTIILLVAIAAIGGWIISTYNFFAGSKARIKAAVQEIGNQLKRQAGLIPNLESSVKGYLKHESSIYKELTDARRAVAGAADSGNLEKMAKAGSQVSALVPRLQVAVESNPELKASGVVTNLMDELRDTADKVMYARRLVIDLTADYNVRRVTFPSSLIANMLGVNELPGLITPESGEFMKVGEEETKTPKVNL